MYSSSCRFCTVTVSSAVSESADQSITEQNTEVITIAANFEESISVFPYFRKENVLTEPWEGFGTSSELMRQRRRG